MFVFQFGFWPYLLDFYLYLWHWRSWVTKPDLLASNLTGRRPRFKVPMLPSLPRAPLCPWLETMLKSSSLEVDIHNTGSSEHDIRKRIAVARALWPPYITISGIPPLLFLQN